MVIKLIKNVSIIIISIIIFLCLFGAFLFSFSFILKNSESLTFIDAFFASTSAICSVGILPFNIDNFSFLGKFLFLIWIQIGGIGILTIIMLIAFFFAKNGIDWFSFTSGLLESAIFKNLKKILKIVICVTFFFEFLGALLYKILAFFIFENLSFFDSLFISVNMFCNSGFLVNVENLRNFYSNEYFYIISSILNIFGSLGFLFFFEIFNSYSKNKKINFSLTIQLALKIYFIFGLFAWIFYFFYFENYFSLLCFSRSFFTAFSLKSLGILAYEKIFNLNILAFSFFYGLIGTVPLGTGSGLKTSILALIYSSSISFLKGRNNVILCKRIIPWNLVACAYAILFYLNIFSFIVSFFIFNYFNFTISFLSIYVDVISFVLGNGFTWNYFQNESFYIKLLLIISMLFGKILLIILGLPSTKKNEEIIIYPEENIAIF